MKRISRLWFFDLMVLSLAVLAAARPAPGQTLSGTLSNFDVFNQTGQESHGFEIELDGITSQDIASTFGAPYIRYGDPARVDFPGGVLLRYASAYDSVNGVFKFTTPIPANPITATAGHSCWYGGVAGYLASGCEHFGAGLFKSPTAVHYRWLIEDPDPAKRGTLIPGPDVSIAAPLWTVTPGAAGGAPVVNAVIPPPRAPQLQFSDAVWVKVFETETDKSVELNHLLTDDPLVPQNASQTETEWEILQANPKRADHGALQHGKPLGKGNQSVIRRFEFYKYTGAYSAEHEALSCAGGGGKGNACTPPASDIGAYIGAQMAAAQLGPLAPLKTAITSVANNASGQAGIASGSWVTIYGSNLSATTRSWQNADFQGTKLPVALDGVGVTINGKAAAVAFISPVQLNVQAPADNAAGPVQVQVTNSSGLATGTATLQQYAPGFFTFQGKYVAAVHADSAYVAPVGFFGGAAASRSAQPGEILLLFGTGFGPSSPAVSPGQMVSSAAALTDLSQLHVRIGGIPATVQYAGIVAAGEYQFNVVIPALPDGDQTVIADIGGVTTQPGLLISIKN